MKSAPFQALYGCRRSILNPIENEVCSLDLERRRAAKGTSFRLAVQRNFYFFVPV